MSEPIEGRSLWKEQVASTQKEQASRLPIIVGAGIVVALMAGIGGFAIRGSPQTTPASVVAQATATPLVATPTPQPTPTPDECPGVDVYLKVITDQEQQAKWDQAAENAASALNDETLCKKDRSIFAQKYVTDAMEGLYARKFGPGKTTQEDAAKQYQTIVRNAARYGAEPPNPITVAQRAAEGGKFLLAKAAWDDAIEAGTFNTADINLVDSYVDNLTSVGKWWTEKPDGPDFEEGKRYLSTANRISLLWETGSRESWGILRQIVGTDETTWPPPIDTPLLSAEVVHKVK
jgi:hypothetical protein